MQYNLNFLTKISNKSRSGSQGYGYADVGLGHIDAEFVVLAV